MPDRLFTNISRHFLPVEATVLGVKLGELTLWHWQQLEIFESPYIEFNYGKDIADLSLAARICALEPFSKVELVPGFIDRLRWQYRHRYYRDRFADEEEIFFNWLAYQLTPPARWQEKGAGRVKVPGWLYFVSLLMKFGMPERTALAMRPGRAMCYLAAISVSEGGMDFVTDKDVDQMINEGGWSREDLPIFT